MYTLYGKKGSGSASTEAALALIGAPYRVVETASWEQNDAFQRAAQAESPGADSHAGAGGRQRALRKRGHPDPSRQRALRKRSAAARTLRLVRKRSAASYSSPPTATPRSASSISPSAGARMPTSPRKQRIRAGTRARLHQHWDMFADLFPARPYLGGETIGALDHSGGGGVQVVGGAPASEEGASRVLRNADAHRRGAQDRTGLRKALASRELSSPASRTVHP